MRQTTAPLSKAEPRSCTQCGSVFETDYRRCPWDGNELVEGLGRDVLLNRHLGAWRVEAFMAGGGMGRIYRATHHDGTVGALKTLAGDLVASDQGRRRFVREAEALRRLRHKNVVSVLDCQVQTSGPPFLVMEFCEGPTLQEVLQRDGRLSCDIVIEYMEALAAGLGHAHENGLVHRDLKPDNVVLCPGPDGVTPKILDFGVVRLIDEQEEPITQAGHLVGTPMFMAPEQILGERVGPAADFYSLGVLAYVLLEGRPPMDGEGGQMLRRILECEPAAMTTKVPPVLESMIHRLLDKNPDQRLCRAQDVLDLLHQCKKPRGGDEPTAAVRRRKTPAADLNLAPVIPGVTPIVVEMNSTHQEPEPTTDIPEPLGPPQRKLHVLFLVAGLGFAFGLLLISFLWRNNTEVVLLQTGGAVVSRPHDVVQARADETAPGLNPTVEVPAKSATDFVAKTAPEFTADSEADGPAKFEAKSKTPASSEAKSKAPANSTAKSKARANSIRPRKHAASTDSATPTDSAASTNTESPPANESAAHEAPSYEDMLSEVSRQLKLPAAQNDRTNFARWRSIYLSAVLAQNKPKQRKAAEARLRALLSELARR